MQLLAKDIHDIRRKLCNFWCKQKDLGYPTDELKELTKDVISIKEVIDLMFRYYIKPVDVYYALEQMGIIASTSIDQDVYKRNEEQVREQIYRDLGAEWAQIQYGLDDDETDILRI